MGEESRELKEHIGQTREKLSRSLDELQTKFKRTTDWRVQFREHPMAMTALAFGVGMWLAGKLRF